MKLEPLPIRTKIYAGETIDSFARRAAARNHTTVNAIETRLRHTGALTSRSRLHQARLEAWRQLGSIRTDAFSTPKVFDDHLIRERHLCLRCTCGESAVGRVPGIGMVCLRHFRWLGRSQMDIRDVRPAIAAEKRFRSRLAKRGVLFDSPAMVIGFEAAIVAFGANELERRRTISGISAVEVLAYREQVAVAQLLTSAHFLDNACSPLLDNQTRHRYVAKAFVQAIGSPDEYEVWRGIARVGSVVDALTSRLRESEFLTDQPDDTEFKLLRHSTLLCRRRCRGPIPQV
ncbi:hypothetical protein DAVIS_02902 [Mycobacterium marinum]|uniref:Uncharacterized protein n=1 Tax=Mycobacterium marinum TaxID=1781 RepID=A0A3E2MUV3_MYCMR|nr:hypothetical protein DAVIS_02902 [Mycobacterium marinum]